MRFYLALVTLIFSANALAEGGPVPHQFSNGNAIVASEFNANFQELANRNSETQAEVAQLQADIASLQPGSNGAHQVQFVGNSTGLITGKRGYRSMTELCQIDYPQSRLCTVGEYRKTINFPSANFLSEVAWIEDARQGVSNKNSSNCYGWYGKFGVSPQNGLAIGAGGTLQTIDCTDALPISCCK